MRRAHVTGFASKVKKYGRDDTRKNSVDSDPVFTDGGQDVETLLAALTSPGLPGHQAGPQANWLWSLWWKTTKLNIHFILLFMYPRAQATWRHLDKSVLCNFLGPAQPHQLSLYPSSPPLHLLTHSHILLLFLDEKKELDKTHTLETVSGWVRLARSDHMCPLIKARCITKGPPPVPSANSLPFCRWTTTTPSFLPHIQVTIILWLAIQCEKEPVRRDWSRMRESRHCWPPPDGTLSSWNHNGLPEARGARAPCPSTK